jgi:hypothetical protein
MVSMASRALGSAASPLRMRAKLAEIMERYSKPLRLLPFRAERNILRNFMTRRIR